MMVGHRAWHDGISLLSHLDKVANGPSMSMCARSTRGELYARWAVCHRGGPNLRSERLHITGTSVNDSFAGVAVGRGFGYDDFDYPGTHARKTTVSKTAYTGS